MKTGDFNNDGITDHATIIQNYWDGDKIKLLIANGGNKGMYLLDTRGSFGIIEQEEMENGFGKGIGDGIMDMCKECVPFVIHWNGERYETGGYFWFN